MAAEKTVNYTEEQTAELVKAYVAGETVENLALNLGKSVKSIVAKLSREGVYKAKAHTKAGTRVTKADLVNKIADELQLDAAKLESLTKASHEALELLASKVLFENTEA